jgi:hypothetical protein
MVANVGHINRVEACIIPQAAAWPTQLQRITTMQQNNSAWQTPLPQLQIPTQNLQLLKCSESVSLMLRHCAGSVDQTSLTCMVANV